VKWLDVFSGVGMYAYGLNQAGHEVIGFCEGDDYCQQVRKKHWPTKPISSCIKSLTKGLMASSAAGRAKILALPERAPDYQESVLVSGNTSYAPFAWFDQKSQCWRTWQRCFIEGWARFSETWPPSGIIRSGIAYRLTPLACPTAAEGFLRLPTPVASDSKGLSRKRYRGSPHYRGGKTAEALRNSFKDPTYLNPSFAELMMGLPEGYTRLETGIPPISSGKSRNISNEKKKASESHQRTQTSQNTLEKFQEEILSFREFGRPTIVEEFPDPSFKIPVYRNQFWESRQRAGSSLQEVPYRACFKPELPRFFISRLSQNGDRNYDPFMGRGTTLIEAALMGRAPLGCDLNPLSKFLVRARLNPPTINEVKERLGSIDLSRVSTPRPDDLLAFYHPETLAEICELRQSLLSSEENGQNDSIDDWIRMVATTRLSGHSSGFLSAYTLPPNQAVSVIEQERINARLRQSPPRRAVKEVILRKSQSLLRNIQASERQVLLKQAHQSLLLTASCDQTPEIEDSSVDLTVTSPPFLDVVDYRKDNWLRCWFNGIDSSQLPVWQLSCEEEWQTAMSQVFKELYRVTKKQGLIAFEVGEIKKGTLPMEQLVLPCAQSIGLIPRFILINDSRFTKTSHCWGMENGRKGTNTNRVIILQKP